MSWREMVARNVVILGIGLWLVNVAVAQMTATNTPAADAFVRSLDPTHNYGGTGSTVTVVDSGAAMLPKRFYRVHLIVPAPH
jgi:hypothetical protein